ncbi:MAG: hypothetical protein ACOZAM_15005 [Pseudomonadota bacterium]
MLKLLTIMAVAVLVAACPKGAAITCPPLKQYSKAFQAAAAREYAAVEASAPHLVQMVDDYGVSRAAIRACLKRRK